MRAICRRACPNVAAANGAILDAATIGGAAALCKTDLTTELVKEFTELQGIIGGLYARAQDISEAAAVAIYDQYLPASADDAIPRSGEGAVLGLADRIDTISGMFGLGMEPTGSKDPFALRRAANAIVRILAESELPLLLSDIFSSAQVQPEVKTKLEAFFGERIDFYLREARGQAYDVVKAVMLTGQDEIDIRDFVARAEAISAMRVAAKTSSPSARRSKRIKNILEQATVPSQKALRRWCRHQLLMVRSAHLGYALLAKLNEINAKVNSFAEKRDYKTALELIASLRPAIDTFEKVMVMDPNPAIRRTNLACSYLR